MRKSLRLLGALPVVFLFLGCAQNLFATSVPFTFSFSGNGITASGTLMATPVSGGEFIVTSITGTQNGASMTLLAPGAYAGNDNAIFLAPPNLDSSGVAFILAGGSTLYNVYFDPRNSTSFECNTTGSCGLGDGTAIQGRLTEVPEPGTLLLLGSGLVGLGGIARRKLLV
jgi:hypothetical protein